MGALTIGKGMVIGMGVLTKSAESAAEWSRRCFVQAYARTRKLIASTKGQGTTEYAILVGVLVVIAILAIMVFRPKLQELWNAIAEGINGL